MGLVKGISIVSCSLLLTACSAVPGVYFSRTTLEQGYYQMNGKIKHAHVIQLSANTLKKSYSPPSDYRVGPYDILNIIVWDHPELTTPTTQEANPAETGILVSEKGYIFFPFAGEVKVAGLTLNQIRIKLENGIRRYIRNPQISVRVADFRSKQIQVVGEVRKAGELPITDRPLSIMRAIQLAGGVNNQTANTRQIYVLRYQNGQIYAYWFNAEMPDQVLAAEHFFLKSNDIVYVPPAGVSAWDRVVSQIIPTLSGAVTVDRLAD